MRTLILAALIGCGTDQTTTPDAAFAPCVGWTDLPASANCELACVDKANQLGSAAAGCTVSSDGSNAPFACPADQESNDGKTCCMPSRVASGAIVTAFACD